MHTAHYKGTNQEERGVDVNFIFNADFSGDATISARVDGVSETIKIPANILIQFIAYNYVLPRRQEALEQAGTTELLLR